MKRKVNDEKEIINKLLFDKNITKNDILVFKFIMKFCNIINYCSSTNKDISDFVGVSYRQIQKILKKLNELNYIEIKMINNFDRKITISEDSIKE